MRQVPSQKPFFAMRVSGGGGVGVCVCVCVCGGGVGVSRTYINA